MTEPTRDAAARLLTLTSLSDVVAERQLFLWNGRIPMGTATIFAGRGGEGKSTFSLWLASQVTRGLLEGEYTGQPGNVLLVGHEDDLATVVKPRLVAAEADMTRIHSLTITTTIEGLEMTEVPSLAEDLSRIREAIVTTGARLIIVDPLTSMMDGANLDKTSDVRRALNPFTTLAGDLDVAIVALMHFRKGQGDTRDLLSGSHAFRDTARSVILFATDDDTGQRVATVDKSNYSESRGDSFSFNLVSTLIPTRDGEQTNVARVDYLGDSTVTVSDIVNKPDDVNLGEEIAAVVDSVNRHPEGIKPADVATETGLEANVVRSYLSRAARRQLIDKAGYGNYTPKATAATVRAPVALVAPAALNPLSATRAIDATAKQAQPAVALCQTCHLPLNPNIASTGIHPTCEPGEPA